MRIFLVLLLLLACSSLAGAKGDLYRAITVNKSFDETYAMVEGLQNKRHYGESAECIKYPGRGECILYNRMANKEVYAIYVEPDIVSGTRVAVYISDMVDSRMRGEIDKLLRQIKE